MLSAKDCLDYCDLTDDEIRALAEHEHIPEVLAAELGECLLETDVGTWVMMKAIREEWERACASGNASRAAELETTLKRFETAHPTYRFK